MNLGFNSKGGEEEEEQLALFAIKWMSVLCLIKDCRFIILFRGSICTLLIVVNARLMHCVFSIDIIYLPLLNWEDFWFRLVLRSLTTVTVRGEDKRIETNTCVDCSWRTNKENRIDEGLRPKTTTTTTGLAASPAAAAATKDDDDIESCSSSPLTGNTLETDYGYLSGSTSLRFKLII